MANDPETTDVRKLDIAERLAFYSHEMPKRGAYLTAEIMGLAHREIMRLRPVEMAARDLLHAIDNRPGADLGQQAAADAWIALRKALADE